MPTCEMCGKPSNLVRAKIEGSELELCPECAKFGEIVVTPTIRSKIIPRNPVRAPRPQRREQLQMIADDYPTKIREARTRLGLTQEEFAQKLNEKCSIMQKIEAGAFKPSIELARKFERQLNIELVEQYDESGEVPLSTEKSSGEGLTMADFIKVRKKKQ